MKNGFFKTSLLAALSIFSVSSLYAERAPVYISPNNDGAKDTLIVPLKINEKRYIKE